MERSVEPSAFVFKTEMRELKCVFMLLAKKLFYPIYYCLEPKAKFLIPVWVLAGG
jgi:hypothetical protein